MNEQMNILDIDRHIHAGREGTAIEIEDELQLAAYNAGRRMAGKPPVVCSETKYNIGCASRVRSEHPANFRADA
jgi:hypothetical protein